MLPLQLQLLLIVTLVLLGPLLLLFCVARLQTSSLLVLAKYEKKKGKSASLSDLCPHLHWLRGQRSEAGVRADHLRVTVMMMNEYMLPPLSFKNFPLFVTCDRFRTALRDLTVIDRK